MCKHVQNTFVGAYFCFVLSIFSFSFSNVSAEETSDSSQPSYEDLLLQIESSAGGSESDVLESAQELARKISQKSAPPAVEDTRSDIAVNQHTG